MFQGKCLGRKINPCEVRLIRAHGSEDGLLPAAVLRCLHAAGGFCWWHLCYSEILAYGLECRVSGADMNPPMLHDFDDGHEGSSLNYGVGEMSQIIAFNGRIGNETSKPWLSFGSRWLCPR